MVRFLGEKHPENVPIFVQDTRPNSCFCPNISQISVTGDTSFRSGLSGIAEQVHFPYIEQFKSTYRLMGWHIYQDEQILTWFKNYRDNYKLVIAPHEVPKE